MFCVSAVPVAPDFPAPELNILENQFPALFVLSVITFVVPPKSGNPPIPPKLGKPPLLFESNMLVTLNNKIVTITANIHARILLFIPILTKRKYNVTIIMKNMRFFTKGIKKLTLNPAFNAAIDNAAPTTNVKAFIAFPAPAFLKSSPKTFENAICAIATNNVVKIRKSNNPAYLS